jgi:hypothetical protein
MAGCFIVKGKINGTITYFEGVEAAYEWAGLYLHRHAPTDYVKDVEEVIGSLKEEKSVICLAEIADPELSIWLFVGTENPFGDSAYLHDTVDSQTGLQLGPTDTLGEFMHRWNASEYDEEDERGEGRWVE